MTKIVQISGTGGAGDMLGLVPKAGTRKLFTLLGRDIGEVSEGEMDLLIARDNMITKRDIVASVQGIGSLKAQKFHNSVDVMDDALHALTLPNPVDHMIGIEEDILNGEYSLHDRVAGIGNPAEINNIRKHLAMRRRANRIKRVQAEQISGVMIGKRGGKPKTKTGGFLKRAAQRVAPVLKKVVKAHNPVNQLKFAAKGLKKVAKKVGPGLKKFANSKAGKILRTVLNPAGALTRLAVKGILEVTLPKAAPFFLYLFINDPAIIAKLPPKVKRKRDKSLKVKNFIVNVIGMKDEHFMGICRNGIMKQMGASPETILSRSIKGISGIGADPYTAAIMFVIQLITKLVQVFKKKKTDDLNVTADDAPSESDFAETSEAEKTELSTEIKKQNDLPEPNEDSKELVRATDRESAIKPSFEQSSSDSSEPMQNTSRSGGGSDFVPKNGKGGSSDADSDSEAPTTPVTTNDTTASGEIKKEPYATGGRKEWNSFGK